MVGEGSPLRDHLRRILTPPPPFPPVQASKKLVKGTDEGAEEEFNTVLDNVKKARVNLTNLGKAFLEGVESGEEEANQERRERWSKNK